MDPAPAAAPAAEAPRGDSGNAASALEMSELPVRQSANEVLRGRINARDNGDWDQLPSIPRAAAAAAYALDESAQVTLVDTVGAALKAVVTSTAFRAEHDAYVRSQHQGVDHGSTGVVGLEEAMAKQDTAAFEAIQARESIVMTVEHGRDMPGEDLGEEFTGQLDQWQTRAAAGEGATGGTVAHRRSGHVLCAMIDSGL